MYRRTTKGRTNVNECHNALNSSDLQAYKNLQAVLLFAFIKQHHAHQLLLAAIVIDLQDDDEDDSLFMLCLRNYQSKTRMVKVLLSVEFFFMTIFPEQRVPRPLYLRTNQTFASLDPSWCYRYTRFTNQQLQLLFELLNLPPCFLICNGKCHCSSEEAFIITLVKLAMGATNLGLQDLFGEKDNQRISDIYNHTIRWLASKAAGLFQPPCLEQWNDNFPIFAGVIEGKIGEEAYGGLQFDSFQIIGFIDCKICETCRPGSGPVEDRPLAPRHEDADILQESVYLGYIRRHGLKILSVVFPNGMIGYVYGPISGRENDIGALNISQLNQHRIDCQEEVMQAQQQGKHLFYYSFYGNGIFPFCIASLDVTELPLEGN